MVYLDRFTVPRPIFDGTQTTTTFSNPHFIVMDSSDEDTISLTSTVVSYHESDEEFEVEDILAVDNGEPPNRRYLIRWEGYPLYRSTWEPEVNLTEAVMDKWIQKEAQIRNGQLEPFDVQSLQNDRALRAEQKLDRQRRREKKRKNLAAAESQNRRGSAGSAFGMVGGNEDNDSSSEAIEDNTLPEMSSWTTRKRVRQTIFGASLAVTQTELNPRPPTKLQPPLKQIKSQTSKASTTPADAEDTQSKPKTPANATSIQKAVMMGKTPQSSKPASSAQISTRPVSSAQQNKTSVCKVSTHSSTKFIGEGPFAAAESQAAPQSSLLPRPQPRRYPSQSNGGSQAASGASKAPNTTGQPILSRRSRGVTSEMAADLKASKKPTAKRSNSIQPSLTNVFAGGKVRKSRVNVIDKLKDFSKLKGPAKHFSSAHAMRTCELKQRQLNDTHVPFHKLPASLREPSYRAHHNEQDDSDLFSTPGPKLESQGPAEIETRPKTKQKSVRFYDDPVRTTDDDVMMAGEEHVILADELMPLTNEQMDIDSSNEIIKYSVVGSLTEPFELAFEGVSLDKSVPWVRALSEMDILSFNEVCYASRAHLPCLNFVPQFHGSIRVNSSESRFEDIMERLRLGHCGLLMRCNEFAILLYMATSEEWTTILRAPSSALSSEIDTALRYSVLESIGEPLYSDEFKLQNVLGNDLPDLLSIYFGWKLDNVLPSPGSQERQAFYLLFPESKSEKRLATLSAVGQWICANTARFPIYSNHSPGAWQAFLNHGMGTVIIHHSCLCLVRHVPSLAEILCASGRYKFWVLDELAGSDSAVLVTPHDLQKPRLGLSRIFPDGAAFLLTPSFVLTEPKATLDILTWYRSHCVERKKDGPCWHLVTCSAFQNYLLQLCEQDREQNDTQSKMYGRTDRAFEESRHHISLEFIAMRYESVTIIDWLSSPSHNGYLKDHANFLIEAPPEIDVNDEQSLINWFGHWSLLNLARYRQFYVLGTQAKTGTPWDVELASTVIKMPKFGRLTVADPDIALAKERLIPNHWEMEPDLVRGSEQESASISPSNALVPKTNRQHLTTAFSKQDTTKQPSGTSLMFTHDGATKLRSKLKGINQRHLSSKVFWHLYNRPTSWDGKDMQEHFEMNHVDQDSNYERFQDWWSHVYPFGKMFSKRFFNTYMGFFYTIDSQKPWTSDQFPKGFMPPRHPWIAVYRIEKAHIRSEWKSHRHCELLIWDPYASRRFMHPKKPTLHEFPDMQKKLCQWVTEKTGYLNEGSVLNRIWYGGFVRPEGDSSNPLDLTMETLDLMAKDPKRYLPPVDKVLVDRGWQITDVKSAPAQPPSPAPPAPPHKPPPSRLPTLPPEVPGESMEVDVEEIEAPYTQDELVDPDLKMVVHPPRGKAFNRRKRVSKCRNSLFDKACRVLTLKARAKMIRHEYRPTMEWYQVQMREGRGYSHIKVLDWDSFRKELHIGFGNGASRHE